MLGEVVKMGTRGWEDSLFARSPAPGPLWPPAAPGGLSLRWGVCKKPAASGMPSPSSEHSVPTVSGEKGCAESSGEPQAL